MRITPSAVAVLLATLAGPAGAQSVAVVDGDTVHYTTPSKPGLFGFGGTPSERITCRLIGFDAPEISHAQCEAERALGRRAKDRLEHLVQTYPWKITYGSRLDRYGRRLCRLTVRGENVADVLISEGLAHPYSGRGPRPNWCEAADGR